MPIGFTRLQTAGHFNHDMKALGSVIQSAALIFCGVISLTALETSRELDG